MINYDLTKIKACVFDVDGVLSHMTMALGSDGLPSRTGNVKDGYAIQQAMKVGLRIAIITGARVPLIKDRYVQMGVEDVYLGAVYKIDAFEEFLLSNALQADEVLYMGDDIPDYEVLKACGLPCCPADAAPEVKAICNYISPLNGGEGCARDVIEQILKSKGLWMNNAEAFGW